MIYYITTAAHSYTMGSYLLHWGEPLQSRVVMLPYEELFDMPALPAGSYIFTDMDRLSEEECVRAAAIHKQLILAGMRVLNHPLHSLNRFELLRTLYKVGTNSFNVFRVSELTKPHCNIGWPARFPVIVRADGEHQNCTDLLHSEMELEEAITSFMSRGYRRSSLMVIEFCDTADKAGIIRKYGAFRIGDHMMSRGIYFSHAWRQNDVDLTSPQMIEEERDLLRGERHIPQLREIFDLACIDHGRIDYGMLDGVPQVWEINSNPMIIYPPDHFPPAYRELQRTYAARQLCAYIELDEQSPSGFSIPMRSSA